MSTIKLGETLFEIVIPLAMWKSKGKSQIISLNNTSRWHRYGATRIKNEYKQLLTDFFIPEPLSPLRHIHLSYQILRHNKRKLDSDAIAWVTKWFVDTLTDVGWLIDDDQVHFCITPSVFTKGLNETQLRVIATEIKD